MSSSNNFDAAEKIFNERFAPAKFRAALQEAGSYGLQSMKSDTPVITGNLRDSESMEVTSDYEMELRVEADYAVYVNDGTSRQRPNGYADRGKETTAQRLLENVKKM